MTAKPRDRSLYTAPVARRLGGLQSVSTTAKTCNLLIRDALILTLDADDRIMANGTVAVSGDRIVSVDPADDHRVRWLPGKTLHAGGDI